MDDIEVPFNVVRQVIREDVEAELTVVPGDSGPGAQVAWQVIVRCQDAYLARVVSFADENGFTIRAVSGGVQLGALGG